MAERKNDDWIRARLAAVPGLEHLAPEPKYDKAGVRLTDCCGAYSTHAEDGVLYCKECFADVPVGQGDGNEKKGG
jgi:hypothetical protein